MAKLTQRLTPTEARQGSSRRMNLRVLIGSLALMVVAGLLFYATMYSSPQAARSPQQEGEIR